MNDDRKRLLLVLLGVTWAGAVTVQYLAQPAEVEVPLTFVSGQPARVASHTPDTTLLVRPLQRQIREIPTASRKNIFAPLGTSQQVPIQTAQGAERSTKQARRAPVVAAPPELREQEAIVLAPPPVVQPVREAAEPVPEPEPGPSPEEIAAQAAQVRLAARLKQIRDQMNQYQYLGYQTLGGERRAFLGKDRDIFVVRLGDKVDGRFVVQSIDGGSVKLREPQAHVEATLELKKDG